MRRIRAGIAFGVLMASIGWSSAASAADDNMVPSQTYSAYCTQGMPNAAGPCQTQNNPVWTWWYQPSTISSTDFQVAAQVMGGEFNPTDLIVDHVATNNTVGPDRTDLLFQRGTLDPQYAGYTWCQHPILGTWTCDQHYVRIKVGQTMTYGLVCHEFGHAVGLMHGSQAYPVLLDDDPRYGCLRNPLVNVSSLGTLNINEINDVY